jgi:hypothetical protein
LFLLLGILLLIARLVDVLDNKKCDLRITDSQFYIDAPNLEFKNYTGNNYIGTNNNPGEEQCK